MPGKLIQWGRNRFLRRKSPERAVHVILPPEPSRHVRFDEWDENPGRSGDQPSPLAAASTTTRHDSNASDTSSSSIRNGNSPSWRYAEDIRVQIAPLARAEDVDLRERRSMSAPRHNGPPQMHHGNGGADFSKTITNSYQEDTFDEEPRGHHLSELAVVFLQRNDEIKRTMLPSDIRSIRQVHAAFCRAFNLTMTYMQQPHVRVYIQEPRGQLFYELEDPMDVRDKSVLRLKEGRCPSPPRQDYLSETDLSSSINSSLNGRPASAMAAFAPQPGRSLSPFGPPKPSMYDPYDPYASDTASSQDSRSIPRSGSATPVIDRETRVRMDTMERQLAGLSSLVHSALKGMDETSVRDMEILRRQVAMSLQNDRAPSEEPPSLPDSYASHSSERTHAQLAALRERVQQTATDMRQLRRVAQVNAQNSRDIIKSANEQITRILAERMGRRAESVLPAKAAEARREEHGRQVSALLGDLTAFERNVEEVRNSVLNTNRKLRISEVERLTSSLTDIGRAAANLKTAIPEVHGGLEAELLSDVERARAEKSEALTAIDQSLRRCKALANIMVTMKKLAMVQDPGMQRASSKAGREGLPPSPAPSGASSSVSTPTYKSNGATPSTPTDPPPPVPPSPANYQSPTSSLDGVLREVSTTPTPTPPSSTSGQPPRPPSRFSVKDARQRQGVIMGTSTLHGPVVSTAATVISAPTASPSPADPESEARRTKLEERQAQLAEKQRQLHSQFEQLQQLAPN